MRRRLRRDLLSRAHDERDAQCEQGGEDAEDDEEEQLEQSLRLREDGEDRAFEIGLQARLVRDTIVVNATKQTKLAAAAARVAPSLLALAHGALPRRHLWRRHDRSLTTQSVEG